MAIFTVGGLAAILAALGIILILGIITYEVIKEKLRSKDFFKATIKEKTTTMGVPVIKIDMEDVFGNSVDQMKLASAEGIDVAVGMNIYKSQL